jgi:SPP1 family phage portal protein
MEDSEGKIEGKQLEIPVEARKEALRILEEKIYELGRGVKFTQDKLGNNPSGVSLKFLYNDLDSKAQDVITSLEAALEEFSWFVTDHIKRTQNQSFDYTQIEYVFTKSMISNEKEIIDNLNSSTDMMTREDRIAQHPYNTRDAKTILTEIKKDEEESMDSYSSLLDKQKQLGGEVDEE